MRKKRSKRVGWRKFSGKWYKLYAGHRKKSLAKKQAASLRKRGYNARVMPGKDYRGKRMYHVYSTYPHKRR